VWVTERTRPDQDSGLAGSIGGGAVIDLALQGVEVYVAGVELAHSRAWRRTRRALFLGTQGGHGLLELDLPQPPSGLRSRVLEAERVEREVERAGS